MKKIIIGIVCLMISYGVFASNVESKVKAADKCVNDILKTSGDILDEVDKFCGFIESLGMSELYLEEIKVLRSGFEAVVKKSEAYFDGGFGVVEKVRESNAIVSMASLLNEYFYNLVEKIECDYGRVYSKGKPSRQNWF